ncbi:yedL, putative acetyltransferase [Nostoc flagelliforme CCNUN1]|uniref:YedL, putative acetyltransferase n=1 Tax=Nostoc flagelliforme CCNUN1 TaxID=2038116 RepID=A0A2K8STS0_9NOSO|nr:yedL, putative acetyltransferase [Nostoc flagelliforme CCNUN1]
MQIRLDDLRSKKITDFLLEHLENMHEITPPQSVHALDLEALRLPDITFFSAWEGDELLGCGALKELDSRSGEIKSMRTAKAHRRKGVASKILEHIIKEAERRAYHHLNLETGAIRVRPSTSLVHTIWVRVPKPLCRLH